MPSSTGQRRQLATQPLHKLWPTPAAQRAPPLPQRAQRPPACSPHLQNAGICVQPQHGQAVRRARVQAVPPPHPQVAPHQRAAGQALHTRVHVRSSWCLADAGLATPALAGCAPQPLPAHSHGDELAGADTGECRAALAQRCARFLGLGPRHLGQLTRNPSMAARSERSTNIETTAYSARLHPRTQPARASQPVSRGPRMCFAAGACRFHLSGAAAAGAAPPRPDAPCRAAPASLPAARSAAPSTAGLLTQEHLPRLTT